jgi:L-alanine-DL-glutamate epimerase-like enolase superfamily enzyme
LEEVHAALERHGGVLAAAAGGATRAELVAACAAESDLPQALAAIDLALWDLEGRRTGQPLWKLLGAAEAPEVVVNATVSAEDACEAGKRVASARRAGFGCVKLKVAVGDDAGRLAAARAAGGSEMAIRIDANGGWSVEQAVSALETLTPFGIELCEEPVHGVDATARVAAHSQLPIALDETASAPGALERRVCEAVCLKLARCGGVSGVLRAAAKARSAGYRVYLSSTLDGPLGIAAALHAAAAVAPDLPCGLATLEVFSDRPDVLPARWGRMRPPPGPGLGDGLLRWYR